MRQNDSLKVFSKSITYVFMVVFVLLPTLLIFIVCFLKADSIGNIQIIFTLENFKKLLDPIYFSVLLNSLKIAFFTTFSTLLLAYPLAYIISKMSPKTKFVLLLLIILPYWTNSLIRTYSFMAILRADGIINKLLILLGIVQKPVQLLYTEGAVVVTIIYLLLPVMFLPIYSSVSKLDFSYIEASRDLGANSFQTFTNVIFPLTLPGIIAGTILVFTPCLGLFFISDLIGGGKTVLLGNVIKDQFSSTRNLPFGSTLSVVMMSVALVFIAVYFKIAQRDNDKKGI